MPRPHTHLFHLEVRVSGVAEPIHMMLPSWTPGSYLLREFPGQVERFEAADGSGRPLSAEKVDKNRWRIEPDGAEEVVVRYRVHADELSVRTSHLDATHGFVTGTSVFMRVEERPAAPCALDIDTPPGWKVVTEIPRSGDRYVARDYDHLVDSPIEIGTPTVVEFDVGGVPHRYVFWGEGNWQERRLIDDTRRIVEANRALFGGPLPYPSYTILVHLIPGGRGGLEHRDSTALHADPEAFQGSTYEQFLALVAHEHLHVWNGKRIRPEPLGPFEYTRENYTRNLWVMEGLTTYYTEIALLRAGIIQEPRFLDRLGGLLDRYLTQPGRLVQTLAESSFDAWIKLYRQTAHSPNAQISYYVKGAVVGLILDLTIRERTGGQRALDDVMRALWHDYGSKDRGFPEESRKGIERIVREATGLDLSDEFDQWLRTTVELPLEETLASVGVRLFRPSASPSPTDEGEALRQIDRHLGLLMRRDEAGHLIVDRVRSDTPAWEAEVNARDQIVSIDDTEPNVIRVAKAIAANQPSPLRLRVRRRDRDMELSIDVPPGPVLGPWRLDREPRSDAERELRFATWTSGSVDERVTED